MGGLEEPLLHANGAGESALLMSEEFGLQQRIRQGGAVHGDEQPLSPRTIGVDRARDQFLAGPAFAFEQDCALACRHTRHELIHLQHERAAAHQRRQLLAFTKFFSEPRVLLHKTAVIETAPDHQFDFLFLEGFCQVVIGALLDGLDRSLHRSERGQEHDEGIRTDLLEFPQHFEAVHRAHSDVGQDHIEPFQATSFDCLGTIDDCLHLVALLAERLHQEIARDGVVIHHKNGALRFHRRPSREPPLHSPHSSEAR